MEEDIDWLLVVDFNLIWQPSDTNKPGENIQEMLKFNAAINNLRLEELQLIDNIYT
jgi:hypothetical protein